MERKIKQAVRGYKTKDGAGVNLVRVLADETVEVFDPILMLDSFDSTNSEDYTAGFPMHPHRGIETISYVYRGYMTHRDSLGNEDTIGNGEVQWMTAGSGILHEEKLPAAERLLGVQLWLNLPAKDKMVPPAYHSIKNSEIKEIELERGKLRLLAGELTSGDHVKIGATDKKAHVLFVSSLRLDEPVVWGGPIVMNTREELNEAFDDLKKGTFVQNKISY